MKLGKAKFWMVGLLVILISGVAYAVGPGAGAGNWNCPGLEGLNLSADQRTKMNDLYEKHWKDTVTLRNELQAKRLELRALWAATNPDKAKIDAKQREINDLRNKLQTKSTDYQLEVRKNLTPEQAAQLGPRGFGPGAGGRRAAMGRGMNRWGGGPGAGNCPGYGQGFGPGPRF